MDGEKSHSQRTIEGQRQAAEEGRFPGRPLRVSDAQICRAMHLGTTEAARRVGLSRAQFIARRKRIKQAQETA
jgi:DNA invertase Pin-like site-specific DNA recombinase